MRLLQRLRRILLAALLALAGLIIAAVLVMQTPWATRRVRDLATAQAAKVLNGQLEIDRLDGGLLTGVELLGVRLRQASSTPVTATKITVRYSIWQLLRGDAIIINALEISGLQIAGERMPDGGLNLGRLVKPRPATAQPRQRRPIQIRNIRVSGGALTFSDRWGPGWMRLPTDIRELNANLDLEFRDGHWLFTVRTLNTAGRAPTLQVDAFSGDIRLAGGSWSVTKGNLRTTASHIVFDVAFGNASGIRTYEVVATGAPFDFPEMSGIVPGLVSLKVPAHTSLSMRGPEQRVQTRVNMHSSAGDVESDLYLDVTQPGWRGDGTATLKALNIAMWLPTTTQTRITGSAQFDLLLGIGRHFPRGTFTFDGPEVVYAGYEAAQVRTAGRLIEGRALISRATMTAYGSPVTTSGWLGLPAPYQFELSGRASHMDLRLLPESVPLPKVPSDLTFDFDARGHFQDPVLSADTTFADSTFLGAAIQPGATGSVDTSAEPITYSGRGRISNLNLATIGQAFRISTLVEPSYAGVVAGMFDVVGQGTTTSELMLTVKGEGVGATIFGGQVADTSMDLVVRGDSLSGTSRGRFEKIDPRLVTRTADYQGSVTGQFDLTGSLPGVFGASPGLADANLAGRIGLDGSRIGALEPSSLELRGKFAEGLAEIEELSLAANGANVKGTGRLAVLRGESDLGFEMEVPDLRTLRPFTPLEMSGMLTTRGQLTGPVDLPRFKGTVTTTGFAASPLSALSARGDYDIAIPERRLAKAHVNTTLEATFLRVMGTSLGEVTGRIDYAGERIRGVAEAHLPDQRVVRIEGAVTIHADHNEAHLSAARIQLGSQVWQIAKDAQDPRIVWSPNAISLHNIAFEGTSAASGRLTAFGTLGRTATLGSVSIDLRNLNVEDLPPLFPAAAGYRGILSGTALVTGSLADPEVHMGLIVANGGFRQFTFTNLTLLARWVGEGIQGDVRIEQQPGLWLSVRGSIPTDVFAGRSNRPLDLTVRSSVIDLAVVQGATAAVSDVAGTLQIDVRVQGNVDDPLFDGFVNVSDAAFRLTATGVRYKNGVARFKMTRDNVVVEQFRIDDDKGDVLQLTGIAGTRQLRLGQIALELSASRFELLQNELGDVDVDAVVTVSGSLAAPVINGDVVLYRANVRVDRLMDALQRPYQIEQSAAGEGAAESGVAAPRQAPFAQRVQLGLHVLAPNNLTLRGDNLRFGPGSPLGLGNIDVTLGGDLTIRKSVGENVSVTGALSAVRGYYGFQGRQFAVERGGSIRFAGGSVFDPVISIAATRVVAGVDVRVSVQGTARKPVLQLSSSPGLEESDILSLLVFNVPANELGDAEREQLAVRAASLAVGYVASPVISAFGQALGLDFLQVEQTGNATSGLRVAAGREVWRGLFLTYGREFGPFEYNEFLAEYELSRYLRIRANASDARGVRSRSSLFRRVETAGIDLIFFFSY